MAYINFKTKDKELFFTRDQVSQNDNLFKVKSNFEDDTVTLFLYRNNAEEERVDKTDYLQLVDVLVGTLREEADITAPVLDIEYEGVPNFNYAYIEQFNRYYFVDSITSVVKNIWSINFSEDYLMTYKDDIKLTKAFVDRNEFDYNDKIVDDKMVVEQGQDITEVMIPNSLIGTAQGIDDVNNGFHFSLTGMGIVNGDATTNESAVVENE